MATFVQDVGGDLTPEGNDGLTSQKTLGGGTALSSTTTFWLDGATDYATVISEDNQPFDGSVATGPVAPEDRP